MEAWGVVTAQVTQRAKRRTSQNSTKASWGDQWQCDPSHAASYFPSPGKDPPLASLLWDCHLKLQLGERLSLMHEAPGITGCAAEQKEHRL